MSMSINDNDSELDIELSKERQNLFEKLSNIFGPETAQDYVLPKTNETRQQLSLEELRVQSEALKHIPPRILLYTTAKASYQSFVRDQVAQQSPRYELEQFVRNSSDIDSAKRYINMINEVLVNPGQSLLLYRSSKLNEQKANLLKTSNCNNVLQELNNDPSIQKYFPPIAHDRRKSPTSEEDEFFGNKINSASCHSMHVKYNDKKYHVQFLKKYGIHHHHHHESDHSTTDHHLCLPERLPPRNIESLLSAESSTKQVTPSITHTSTIHRETFPPLSLTALKEYRPTMTPKEPTSRQTSSTINSQYRQKPLRKKDFLWNQSIASTTKHE